MQRKNIRRGFSLVEILIVIAVIGILSSIMMISSTSAVSSAKAAKIINDLRSVKLAVLAWYGDNLDDTAKFAGTTETTNTNTTENNSFKNELIKYLNTNSNSLANYQFVIDKENWYVCYSGTDLTSDVKNKLKARAKTAELLKTASRTDEYDGTGNVYMFIR